MAISLAEVLKLTVPDRVHLVAAIWDSIAEVPESIPLTDAQRTVLDERLAFYQSDPIAGSPWAEVRERILGRG